jgi:GDP/UDP-N,N'-diacetylbacillosamine 2-epimerase (hydrolysing)
MSRARAARRRIAVVTGTRAEYGLLRPVLRAIAAHPCLTLQLAVTGMHLLRRFGHTVDEIASDGWTIDARVRMQAAGDGPTDQADGLARGVRGLARFFTAAETDVVVVLGDRIEAMAGALAAVTTGRVLAHIHGGDIATGDIDEALRHAITKLAHLHFAATPAAAQRVRRMGEPRGRIWCVGAPGLDGVRDLLATAPRPRRPTGLAVVAQHAYGRTPEVERRVAANVLRAVADAGLRRLIIYPNTDRGHTGVLAAVRAHARTPGAEVVRSLPRDEYLRRLATADVLIGNSSSGIIEAPFVGTPSVDVGERQAGRELGGTSVVHAAESYAAVRRALDHALRLRPRRGGRTTYGDGRAGPRIAALLARVRLTPGVRRKQLDLPD